jgi:hypothetical protein
VIDGLGGRVAVAIDELTSVHARGLAELLD